MLWVGIGAGGIAALGLGAWFFLSPAAMPSPRMAAPVDVPAVPTPTPVTAALAPQPPPVVTAPAPPVVPAALSLPAIALPILTEAAILAHRAEEPRLLRLEGNPGIFILDFPSLDAQGAALNRVAALVEKAGLPRDRVLTEAELAAAIARSGDTPATYYFGHNYRGVDLARFFALASRDNIPLTPAEAWVAARLQDARAVAPTTSDIAILSIAAPGRQLDAAGRATILRHEIGHGLFITRPDYAAHVRRVWHTELTEAERAGLRGCFAREGYDPSNEELMIDEAQAYLLFTPDTRFFDPASAGLSPARAAAIRDLLRQGLGPSVMP